MVDGKKGKIDELNKFLSKMSSMLQKSGDAEKQLLDQFGINFNMPKNGNEAVQQAVSTAGQNSNNIEIK